MFSKTWLPALALTTGLLLGATTTALTQTTTTAPTQQPGQRPGGGPGGGGGRHPHILGAERALQHAARQLEEAAHDYGGHRVKALELVRQAEGELHEAVAFAQSHPEAFKTSTSK